MHKARTTQKTLLLAIALFALAVGFAAVTACGGSEPGSASTGAPKADILKVADDLVVLTWDPRASGSGEVEFLANVYEQLVVPNPAGGSGNDRYLPALAESWDISDDGLEYTFHLRKGVTFHDGTHMDAKAVKYSIEATQKLGLGFAYLWADLKSIDVIDDYTVKFTMTKSIPLLAICASEYGAWIFSPATKGKPQKWWDEGRGAGTGPYMVESYKPQQEIVLKQYPAYWGGWKDNQFKKLVFQSVTEDTTAQQLLESGQIDWSNVIPYDQIDTLKANPELYVGESKSMMDWIVMLNCVKKGPLTDKRVRQALSYATPVADIIQVAVNGFGTPAAGIIPAGVWPHSDKVKPYPYDLEKAKQLLAEAGYADGFDLELCCDVESGALAKNSVTLMMQSFAKIGVKATVKVQQWNTLYDRFHGDPQKAPDTWMISWYPSIPHGYDALNTTYNPDSEWNLSFWSNDQFMTWINKAWEIDARDPQGAMALYDQAQQMLYDEAPTLYLFDDKRVNLCRANIAIDTRAVNMFYPNATLYYFLTLK